MKKIYFLIATIFICFAQRANAQEHALNFDAINDYIDVGNWWTYSEFTVQMWVNPAATQNQYAMLIDNNHLGNTRWNCQQNAGITNTYVFGMATANNIAAIHFGLTANTWQQLTLVKSDSLIKVYIDGVLFDSAFSSGAITGGGVGQDNIWIGNWNSGGRNWNGTMDEIRLWDYPLSFAEVQASYNCALTGIEPGLLVYYKLNQGIDAGNNTTITVAIDSSGNAHHGTLSGFDLTGTTSNFIAANNTPVNCTMGINDVENSKDDISIFPNPASDFFTINLPENHGDSEVRITDISGKFISAWIDVENRMAISTSAFDEGVYIVHIKNGIKQFKRKLVVAK